MSEGNSFTYVGKIAGNLGYFLKIHMSENRICRNQSMITPKAWVADFSWTSKVNFCGHFFNSNEKSYTIIKPNPNLT